MIRLTEYGSGKEIHVNPALVAYVAEPPEADKLSGVGCGIAFIDNTAEVIQIREPLENVVIRMEVDRT